MGKKIEAQNTFQDKLRRIWSNLIKWGADNQEKFLFVSQFCYSPYITKFAHEEVIKEYVFLHDLVNQRIKTGVIRDFSAELTIAVFYQASRMVVNLIPDSDSSQNKNKFIEDGFKTIWEGLAKN
jgi:hypothetical protein